MKFNLSLLFVYATNCQKEKNAVEMEKRNEMQIRKWKQVNSIFAPS